MQCRSVTFAWHWDESGGECSNGAARKVICPGLGWSAKLHGGFRIHASVILIRGYALASLPEARAGCSNPARPDPWRGLWATMIPTPTSLSRAPRGISILRIRSGQALNPEPVRQAQGGL